MFFFRVSRRLKVQGFSSKRLKEKKRRQKKDQKQSHVSCCTFVLLGPYPQVVHCHSVLQDMEKSVRDFYTDAEAAPADKKHVFLIHADPIAASLRTSCLLQKELNGTRLMSHAGNCLQDRFSSFFFLCFCLGGAGAQFFFWCSVSLFLRMPLSTYP